MILIIDENNKLHLKKGDRITPSLLEAMLKDEKGWKETSPSSALNPYIFRIDEYGEAWILFKAVPLEDQRQDKFATILDSDAIKKKFEYEVVYESYCPNNGHRKIKNGE